MGDPFPDSVGNIDFVNTLFVGECDQVFARWSQTPLKFVRFPRSSPDRVVVSARDQAHLDFFRRVCSRQRFQGEAQQHFLGQLFCLLQLPSQVGGVKISPSSDSLFIGKAGDGRFGAILRCRTFDCAGDQVVNNLGFHDASSWFIFAECEGEQDGGEDNEFGFHVGIGLF